MALKVIGGSIIYMLDWNIFSAEKSNSETSKWTSTSIELYLMSGDRLLNQELHRKAKKMILVVHFEMPVLLEHELLFDWVTKWWSAIVLYNFNLFAL